MKLDPANLVRLVVVVVVDAAADMGAEVTAVAAEAMVVAVEAMAVAAADVAMAVASAEAGNRTVSKQIAGGGTVALTAQGFSSASLGDRPRLAEFCCSVLR